MKMTPQRELVVFEMRAILQERLFDRQVPSLTDRRRAAAAYYVLKELKADVEREADVLMHIAPHRLVKETEYNEAWLHALENVKKWGCAMTPEEEEDPDVEYIPEEDLWAHGLIDFKSNFTTDRDAAFLTEAGIAVLAKGRKK